MQEFMGSVVWIDNLYFLCLNRDFFDMWVVQFFYMNNRDDE